MMMATQTSRAKRLIKMLERLIKQPYLYDEEQLKLIREQLKVAKNELAMIEEKTSKGFK
tara:strand:- start:326 stop:502 length:177 start_codon:yes stop_codon:yes gene_type:complete